MSGLFGGGPKPPAPPAPLPVVTINETRNAVEKRDALLRRRGVLATVLDSDQDKNKQSNTILGSGGY